MPPDRPPLPRRQGLYWLLTIPAEDWAVPDVCPACVQYCRGQKEAGEEGGYLHWQLLCVFKSKVSLSTVKEVFGQSVHGELSRSAAADEYVWKEATRIDGSQFEIGLSLF